MNDKLALVTAIRYYEQLADTTTAAFQKGYWTGVSYGIQHAIRILEGTEAGDALVQMVIDAQRAEEAKESAVPS